MAPVRSSADVKKSDAPLVEVDRLTCRIERKTILDRVSLSVASGEIVSIIGPNGAGKTTLLKCLQRLLAADSGKILVDGRPIDEIPRRQLARRIAYVPQAEGYEIPFTVEQFVQMGRYPYWGPFTPVGVEDRRATRQAMEATETTAMADRRLDTLSGGERQKVLIAAALAQETPLLLLDEPTSFLDYRHQNEIEQLIRRTARERNIAVISVTHDLNRAVVENDRIVALKAGRVVYDDRADRWVTAESLEAVFGTPFVMTAHPTTGRPVIVPPALEAVASDEGDSR